MYVILFYDIADRKFKERDNSRRIRKWIERFLPRVQYSVFEGEIRESEFKKLTGKLEEFVEAEMDSIVVYTFASMSYNERRVIGVDKNQSLFT